MKTGGWATSRPILIFLGLSVLELGPMYVTDVRQKHRLMPPPYGGGGIDNKPLNCCWSLLTITFRWRVEMSELCDRGLLSHSFCFCRFLFRQKIYKRQLKDLRQPKRRQLRRSFSEWLWKRKWLRNIWTTPSSELWFDVFGLFSSDVLIPAGLGDRKGILLAKYAVPAAVPWIPYENFRKTGRAHGIAHPLQLTKQGELGHMGWTSV